MSVSVKLEKVIICYPHLYEKHAPPGTTNEKYSAEFLLDPQKNQDACAAVDAAFRQVAIAAGKQDSLQYLQSPLKSGDDLNAAALAKGRKSRPELESMMVVRASDPSYQPAVVNARVQPIPESQKSQIFGGCIVNAFVDIYWSGNQANPGVFAGLKGVQLVDNVNVTPLGGGAPTPDQMFAPVEGAPEPQQAPATGGPSQPKEPSWM
jgi:hypothetical protein